MLRPPNFSSGTFLAIYLLAIPLLAEPALSHSPVDFLEVVEATPSLKIEHDVELKSKIDDKRVMTDIEGPVYFSHSVGCLNRPQKTAATYLNWFKIVDGGAAPTRNVEMLDMVRGGSEKALEIGSAEFLLSPAQLIADGTPDPIPDGIDLYKAYRVLHAPAIDREVTVVSSSGSQQRRLGKPVFVCLPTAQWHHHEHRDASHPNDGFVVYELDAKKQDRKVSTIDQFGLNSLDANESRWLCVRAAFLREK